MDMTVRSIVAWLSACTARQDEGQGLVEYGLIIALVAVVCIAGLTLLGGSVNTLLGGITFGA